MSSLSTSPRPLQLLAARLAPAEGFERVAMQLIASAPPSSALAIILDLSDSCGPLNRELDMCPLVVAALPGAWPLWVYRLSSPFPLDLPKRFRLADLKDDRLRLSQWSEAADQIRAGRATGSLLRPVLEALHQRCCEEQIENVIAIIATDGELLDVSPLEPGDRVKLLGLVSGSPHRSGRWQYVLPGVALYSLNDPDLETLLQVQAHPFFGWCQISWQGAATDALRVWCIDPGQRSPRILETGLCECNLAAGPASLVFSGSSEMLAALQIVCRANPSGIEARLKPRYESSLDRKLIELCEAAFRPSATRREEVLYDSAADAVNFAVAWNSVQVAAALAQEHKPWIDASGHLQVFSDASIFACVVDPATGRSHWSALVCIYRGDLLAPQPTTARVVLLGLDRERKPAFKWTSADPLPIGTPITAMEIGYARTSDRWTIRYGTDAPLELEPLGSERLESPMLCGDESWTLLFSGDLST